MKTTRLIFFIVVLFCAAQGFGATEAYWDFEDGTPGQTFYTVGGSNDVVNNHTMYGYYIDGADDSGWFTYEGETAKGYGLAATFNNSEGCHTNEPAGINKWSPSNWTIEVSVYMDDLGTWETFIGKAGATFGGAASDLYFQKTFDGNFRIEFLGADGDRYQCTSTFTAQEDHWYHLAAVGNDSTDTLTLYVDSLDGNGYVEANSIDMNSVADNSFAVPDGNGFDWTFGRGWYSGNLTDNIDGSIDDVRFSDTALSPSQFLHAITDIGFPVPLNNAENIVPDPTLEWDFVSENVSAYSFDVYFSDDYSEVDPATSTTPYAQTSNEYLDLSGLDLETTYYWRVDAIMNEGEEPITGPVWTFTTTGLITLQPEDVVVEEGGTAEISVLETIPADDFTWYKDDIEIPGADSNTLTITDANINDEGVYYCDVNSGGTIETSETARLWLKRLVGHWKLDNNLNDSVQDEVPGAPVHNGTVEDANTAAGDGAANYDAGGIDGQCMSLNFPVDGEYVAIPDPNFFNYWPMGYTSSCWTKVSEPNTGWGVALSKFSTFGWGIASGDFRSAFMWGADNIDAGGATTDEWVMLTITYDAQAEDPNDEFRLFVNGVLLYDDLGNPTTATFVDNALPAANTAPVRIGTDNEDNGLTGLVDDVRLYSYPLSKVEVAQLYQEFVAGSQCVEPPAYDFNGDCIFNLDDFAQFALGWTNCNLVPDCLP